MSFRDLRNLSETLRNINYPRLMSLENFRTPNFKLVAEICLWLIKQYDPDTDESQHNVETEAGRVKFITYFAEFTLKHVQVKLNTKRLYQADGYAVKELIKVAAGLDHGKSHPFNASPESLKAKAQEEEQLSNLNLGNNLEELKRARTLGMKITQRGGALYDLLSKEITLREARYKALSKAFELDEVQRILQAAIKAGEGELIKSETMLENVVANVSAIQLKMDKKRSELERSEKRLSTLKKVKPAFMDEYEKLQAELEKAYREYVVRFRVLQSLHNQVTEMERTESERKAEERLITQELTSDDLLLYHHRSMKSDFSPNAARNSYEEKDDSEDADGDAEGGSDENSIQYNAREFMLSRGGSLSRMRRPQEQQRAAVSVKNGPRANGPVPSKTGLMNGAANGKSARKSAGKPKMYGNLMNGDDDDESESDVLLLDDDNLDQSELLSDGIDDDEDDDIDNELMEMGSDISGRAVLSNAKHNSLDPKVQTARRQKPPLTTNGVGAATFRKDSRASAAAVNANVPASSTKRSSNAKIGGPPTAVPSTSTVYIYDENGMDTYQNQMFNDEDLVVPNGMIPHRPSRKQSSHFQQEMSFISDEVDGFGDSSLTKPLEAPKPSTAISSLTYRKSSKSKSSSRGHRSDHEHERRNGAALTMTNGNEDNDGLENCDNNFSEAHQGRKKSSAGGSHHSLSRSHHRSESGSSSSRSSAAGAGGRPESKSKSGRHHNNGQSASYFVSQPSIVMEEEHEHDEFGGEFEYEPQTRVGRPPSRPGSHYAKKREEMLD